MQWKRIERFKIESKVRNPYVRHQFVRDLLVWNRIQAKKSMIFIFCYFLPKFIPFFQVEGTSIPKMNNFEVEGTSIPKMNNFEVEGNSVIGRPLIWVWLCCVSLSDDLRWALTCKMSKVKLVFSKLTLK